MLSLAIGISQMRAVLVFRCRCEFLMLSADSQFRLAGLLANLIVCLFIRRPGAGPSMWPMETFIAHKCAPLARLLIR